jgi:hypothetical protein
LSFHVTSRRSLTDASTTEPSTEATSPLLMNRSSATSTPQLFFGSPSAPRMSIVSGNTGAFFVSSTTIELWRSWMRAPSDRADSPIFELCWSLAKIQCTRPMHVGIAVSPASIIG